VAGKGIKKLFHGIFSSSTGGSTSAGTSTSTSGDSSTLNFNDEGSGIMMDDTASSDTGTTAESVTNEATQQATSVPTYDQNANTKLNKLIKDTTTIKTSTSALDTNQNCLNAIGKAIVKIIVQKMTLSIVQWIQGGNSGGPMFITDPGKFFKDIAKEQILNFGIDIQDKDKFPFGKAFMQNVATSYNKKFADNATYSLNEMIKSTSSGEFSDQQFKADFSKGGWGAWQALTQVPANNPIGFHLIASNELTKKLDGTDQSEAQQKKDLLSQSNGFLGDQKCTDPWGTTKEQDQAAITAGVTLEQGTKTVTTEIPGEMIMGDEQNYTPDTISTTYTRCKKWEYVTPGAVVGHALTKSIDDNSNSLLSAETLNDAIAAILDAALARFSNELTTKGLANMSTDTNDYPSPAGNNDSTSGSKVETDFANPSNWLLAHPNFDIHNDFNQALIDTEKTYVSKLESYNLSLNDLVTQVYKLDYCIPGPHPGWEEDSRKNLAAALEAIPAETVNSVSDKTTSEVLSIVGSSAPAIGVLVGLAIGASAGSVVPGIGTAIGAVVGVVAGLIVNWIDNSDDSKKIHSYYAGEIGILTGIHVGYKGEHKKDSLTGNLENKSSLTDIMNTILDRYIQTINNIYRPEYLPAVAPEAKQEFLKIPGYKQIIENNKAEISFRKGIITRMENLKQKIDDNGGPALNPDLDNPLSATMSEFSRLSSYFVSGDDIANVDNLYKETIDKRDYVYNDLLTGPYGCENDRGHFPDGGAWGTIDETQRMTYYPLIEKGYIPYPRGLGGYKNSTGELLKKGNSGPGFLSSVVFGGTTNGSPDPSYTLEKLDVTDLFPIETWASWVGKTASDTHPNGICPDYYCGGVFERIIGVY
jgi:hypothetical protein